MKLSFPIYRLKRQAKLLARRKSLPLHRALDQIAQSEGYRTWSHLSAAQSAKMPVHTLVEACKPGEILLIAGRPGHGKTQLGLDLLNACANKGRAAFFFTLEYHEKDLSAERSPHLRIDTSDAISADYVVEVMSAVEPRSVAVIDYLQLLDQRRSLPPLSEQVTTLKRFAKARDATIILLSQIDRRFEDKPQVFPGFADIRLPNPLDLSLISQGCFVHDGQVRLQRGAIGA